VLVQNILAADMMTLWNAQTVKELARWLSIKLIRKQFFSISFDKLETIHYYLNMLKMRPEHFELIKNTFQSNSNKIRLHRNWLRLLNKQPKDLEKRLRWDFFIMTLGSKWLCDNLYPYLNDDHIDSALRQVMETI